MTLAPSHSCSYCVVCDASSVVRCGAKDCGKWFCNGSANTAGSHIVNHLVQARHKTASLHESSPLGDSVLECYSCGARNVFLLGFIPSKQDSLVVLLCREPCLASRSIGALKDDPNWDFSLWQPLIEERSFVPWLVKVPDIGEEMFFSPLSNREIGKLEELWRRNPNASLADAAVEVVREAELDVVPFSFESAAHYQKIFSPLVDLEAEYDQKIKSSQSSQNVNVRWDVSSVSKKRLAYFMFTREEHEARLMPGDELRISVENFCKSNGTVLPTATSETATWEAVGYVVRVLPSEEVCLELGAVYSNAPGPWNHTRGGFQVSFVWKTISFDRVHRAMKSFATDNTSVSSVVYHLLLGIDVDAHVSAQLRVKLPKSWDAPNLPKLNHSQVYAVRKAISMPVCIIQGPAGTGKTVTTATLIYHMAQCTGNQILVCAPSNIACDHLTEKIHATGLKVVRVSAKSREDVMVGSSIEFLTLHAQIKQLSQTGESEYKELSKLLALKETVGELSKSDERRYISLRDRIEKKILDAADVICCTCVSAGDPRVNRLRFKHVLIDEATQATEPECLIPLVLGAKQVILIGDHCQLGPVVLSKTAARAGFNRSLFERLMGLGLRPIRLEVQYRQHPALSEFPSQTFYEGTLQNGVTAQERRMDVLQKAFPWPRGSEIPMFFYHSSGGEEISSSGTSYLNRAEALNIEKLVTAFIKAGVDAKQIGVITPYEGQRAHIQSVLQRHTTLHADMYREVEVASVDAFQGREKDLILLSCVRSNSHSGLGFLHDPRRLNVALTRARYGLVICGNAIAISRAPQKNTSQLSVWSGLIAHLQKRSLIVEGPLGAFREVQFTLPVGKKEQSVSSSAPAVCVETDSALEESIRAPSHYFEDRRTSRRRTHSVESSVSYVSQKDPAG